MTHMYWHIRGGLLDLGQKTHVMGVLNITPDSFSDGGQFIAADQAVAHAEQMLAAGADIIDLGGESSRPGAVPVTAEEEVSRVLPVVERLAGVSGAILSVDTTKAVVAGKALRAGAHIVNDISGLRHDPAMAGVIRETGAGLIIMHMRGSPATMQNDPQYRDVVGEVGAFLRERVGTAVASGIARDQLVVDPGIGFGKTLEHNLALLNHLDRLAEMTGCPVMVGVSRKRFIGAITGRETGQRLAGSLAAAAFAIERGARIIRVHDVKESCEMARMIDTLKSATGA